MPPALSWFKTLISLKISPLALELGRNYFLSLGLIVVWCLFSPSFLEAFSADLFLEPAWFESGDISPTLGEELIRFFFRLRTLIISRSSLRAYSSNSSIFLESWSGISLLCFLNLQDSLLLLGLFVFLLNRANWCMPGGDWNIVLRRVLFLDSFSKLSIALVVTAEGRFTVALWLSERFLNWMRLSLDYSSWLGLTGVK